MNGYVRREDVAELICKWCGSCTNPQKNDLLCCELCPEFAELPVADVQPVRRGEWIVPVPGDGEPYCSECKSEALLVGTFKKTPHLSPFCPACGAKMSVDKAEG